MSQVTERQAAKAFSKIRVMLATQSSATGQLPDVIHVDAETWETVEEWTRLDMRAMRKPFNGVFMRGVRVLPPKGYQVPEELGR